MSDESKERKTLYQITDEMIELRDLITYAVDEETGEVNVDDKALADYTAMQFKSIEKIQRYIEYMEMLQHHAMEAEAQYKAMKEMVEKRHSAAKTATNEIEGLKRVVKNFMHTTNQNEIIAGPFRIKLKKNPPSVFVPENINYLDWEPTLYTTTFKPNKKELMSIGKRGEELPDGVYIRQSDRIEIK